MKVLLVSSNSGSIGGGERYLVYLAEGLIANGHDVCVVLSSLEEMDDISILLQTKGVTVRRIPLLGLKHRQLRFLSALLDIKQRRHLVALFRSIEPHVIHINQQYDEDGLDYLCAALAASVAVVGTIHLPMSRGKLNRPFGRLRTQFLNRFYRSHPYEKIFVSRESRDEFCEVYGQNKRTHVVRNGISLPQTDFACIQGAIVPIILGTMGRLDRQKNPLLLLRAFAEMVTSSNAQLVFVGDGPERAIVEQEARALGVDSRVTITGWLQDPRAWWSTFTVFAMSSEFEGMSLALLEAVVRGLPCVVTATQGVNEVAAYATWVAIVPKNDVRRLADALEAACLKPRPARQIVTAVRAEFSCQRMALDTAAVYNAALSARHKAI